MCLLIWNKNYTSIDFYFDNDCLGEHSYLTFRPASTLEALVNRLLTSMVEQQAPGQGAGVVVLAEMQKERGKMILYLILI